jgi:hypothetical protein
MVAALTRQQFADLVRTARLAGTSVPWTRMHDLS